MESTALGLYPGRHFTDFSSTLRKWSEAVFRTLYRATHDRSYRHSARLWHYFKLERDAHGAIRKLTFRGLSIPLENGRAIQLRTPGPVHLIATGPSIAQIDYRRLQMGCAIGVNGAIALCDSTPVKFDYYCMIDTNFVKKRPDLVAKILAQNLTLFITPLILWYILQRFPVTALRCRIYLMEDVREPIFERSRSAADLQRLSDEQVHQFDAQSMLGYSFDITRGFFDSKTVAFTALQVLTWLGYKDIYLHGMDLNNTRTMPRFYENRGTMQPSSIEQDFAAYIEPSFRKAQPLLQARGISVTNLSPTSALSGAIFPKRHWTSLCERQIGDSSETARSAA